MKNWIKKPEVYISAISLVTVLLLWWTLPEYLSDGRGTFQERGAFGDTYGTVNALFTGLALVAIILAILLQSKEIRLAKDELYHTRKEVKKQGATLELQRFESTFFGLLRALDTSISELAIYSNGPIERGERAVLQFKEGFEEDLRKRVSGAGLSLREIEAQTRQAFISRTELDHCFSMVITILQFIDSSKVESKSQYVDFVRAQLSLTFLFVFAYHLVREKSTQSRLIPLCKKHDIFGIRLFSHDLIDESHGEIIDMEF